MPLDILKVDSNLIDSLAEKKLEKTARELLEFSINRQLKLAVAA